MQTPSTFTATSIKTILVNCANSAKYADEIIRSEKLQGTTKKLFKDIERKMLSVERDLCMYLSDDLAKKVREEVSENWETLAYHNINVAVQAMNDAQRQILESVCCHILDGTFRIEQEQA